MRRTRIAAATVMVAAGLMAAVAAPAAAQQSANYGGCVSTGQEDPSEGLSGPLNLQADTASDGTGGNVLNAFFNSDGNSRFGGQVACLPV